jgi:hypothetical protein
LLQNVNSQSEIGAPWAGPNYREFIGELRRGAAEVSASFSARTASERASFSELGGAHLRLSPVTTMSISWLPHFEQTNRSRQSSNVISAP